jgi:hypothetical protein
VPAHERLAGLPEEVVRRAFAWERHVLEVLDGLPPGSPVGAVPRSEYDPARRSLAEREAAKAAEVSAAGTPVSARTVKRYRQRYQADGVVGLVDHRADRRGPEFGLVDGRVVAAMRAAIEETTQASSRTAKFVIWRTRQILAEADPPVVVPSRRTLYRLFDKLAVGWPVTGSARARRSQAARPVGPFSSVTVGAPGEVVQVDSTLFDVLVRLDSGLEGRVELTAMVDVATRTVTAAVLRPSTKAVDVSVLLARSVTPEPMRPGWSQALAMAASALPYPRLLAVDERLARAAARPVIVPETIVCDHGRVFMSEAFRASCRFLGINLQPAHEATPTDKGHVERTLGSVATLFAQFVAGYTGSSTERRGRHLDDGPLWSVPQLQDLLDEWIIAEWQNRPHDGLRDPLAPGRMFTPNEKYTALVEASGYTPVTLTGDDYIELLPAVWQAINAYGIRIHHRTYDAEALGPLRRQPSGVTAKNNRWEIHHDPYDVSRVWVRDTRNPDGGWITAFWTQLHRAPVPFGELAWDHARAGLPAGTEAELADVVTDLLAEAHDGPAGTGPATGRSRSRRDQVVAARTRLTSPPPPDDTPDNDLDDAEPPAKIIPLPLFDPFAEAEKRW